MQKNPNKFTKTRRKSWTLHGTTENDNEECTVKCCYRIIEKTDMLATYMIFITIRPFTGSHLNHI